MRRRAGNDDDLIRAVARQDAAAFAELERRHRRWVERLLAAFARNADEVQDLSQEVFTRIYRHAATYRDRGGFVAWVRRIAINVGSTHYQRRDSLALVPLSILDDTASRSSQNRTDPLFAVLERSLEEDIRQVIAELPYDQREAVLLRCFLGLTVPEIAKRQKCPEGTVKSRLSHGFRRVRAVLEEQWGAEQ